MQLSQPNSPPKTTKGWWNFIFFQHGMLWNNVLRHLIGLCPLGGKIRAKLSQKLGGECLKSLWMIRCPLHFIKLFYCSQFYWRAFQRELLSPCFAKASQHHVTQNFDEASLKCYLFRKPFAGGLVCTGSLSLSPSDFPNIQVKNWSVSIPSSCYRENSLF